GEAGTTLSNPATLTVRDGPIALSLSKHIGQVPVSSVFGHRSMRSVFRVDDSIAVATNSGELIAVSRDGISWVLTVPPIGGLDNISDAGGRLFATGFGAAKISVDGIFWEAVPGMPARISTIVAGDGLYVAAGDNG